MSLFSLIYYCSLRQEKIKRLSSEQVRPEIFEAVLLLLNIRSYLLHALFMLIGNLFDFLFHFLIGDLNLFLLGNRFDQEMFLHVSFGELFQVGFQLLVVLTALFHLETLCQKMELRILHHLRMPGLDE